MVLPVLLLLLILWMRQIQSLDGKLDEKLTVLSATKVEGESGSTDNTDDTSDEDSEE